MLIFIILLFCMKTLFPRCNSERSFLKQSAKRIYTTSTTHLQLQSTTHREYGDVYSVYASGGCKISSCHGHQDCLQLNFSSVIIYIIFVLLSFQLRHNLKMYFNSSYMDFNQHSAFRSQKVNSILNKSLAVLF